MRRGVSRIVAVAFLVLVAGCSGGSDSDALREGRSVYGDVCSACHGSAGQGGVGPALSSVLDTWPDCDDHIEWITLGSEGWRSSHGDTYGAGDRPLKGGMPAQGDALTQDEIRLVAAFQRVTYGGQPRDEALADCGIPLD